MAEIEFDRKVVDDGESPGIPEIVRHKTQYLIQYARRITVEARDRSGKFAKYNGFKLTQIKDNDEYPQEDVEDVCEAIMRLVNAKFAEARAVDEGLSGLDFRIVFDRRPGGKRERPGIDLQGYSPDGPDLPIGHGMTSSMESAAGEIIGQTIEQLGGLVDKLMVRMDGLIGHIVNMSDQHKDMYEPLVKMMAIANQNSVIGIEQQRRALEYIYSTKRIEEEEAGKDRRAEKWMTFLKKPAETAIKQVGKFMQAKVANKGRDTDDDEDDDDDDDDSGEERTTTTSSPKPGQGAAHRPSGPDQETIENPVAAFSQALGQLLLPMQWAQAQEILTKKQFRIFAELLQATTDDEVVRIHDAIEDGAIPLMKLVALSGILDKKQSDGLEQLRNLIANHKKGWAEEESN